MLEFNAGSIGMMSDCKGTKQIHFREFSMYEIMTEMECFFHFNFIALLCSLLKQ